MLVILFLGLVFVALSVWRAHCNPENNINVVDLVLQNGRFDRVAVVFLAAFGVTTWLMVDLEINGKMTEGYLGLYAAAWVGPLVAKVVFGQKTIPTTTMTATVTETKEGNHGI